MDYEILDDDAGPAADVGVSPARARAIRRQKAVEMAIKQIGLLNGIRGPRKGRAVRALGAIVRTVEREYRAAKRG